MLCLIPSYNRARYLEQIIPLYRLRGGIKDLEFVVFTNGSTDNTRQTLYKAVETCGVSISEISAEENTCYKGVSEFCKNRLLWSEPVIVSEVDIADISLGALLALRAAFSPDGRIVRLNTLQTRYGHGGAGPNESQVFCTNAGRVATLPFAFETKADNHPLHGTGGITLSDWAVHIGGGPPFLDAKLGTLPYKFDQSESDTWSKGTTVSGAVSYFVHYWRGIPELKTEFPDLWRRISEVTGKDLNSVTVDPDMEEFWKRVEYASNYRFTRNYRKLFT